jgi:uncharacterized membrane protein YoaK (UPF0700 family)
VGAGALACVAGMVNAVGFLGFEHQAITHLTGTTTLLGASLADGDMRATMHLLGVAFAFFAGATLSGMVIQDATLRLGRRYGVALAIESLLLLASAIAFRRHNAMGALLAAMACGLQNAMATTYSGAVVRTTHLSGMFTDLGIGLGHAVRGLPVQRRRLLLCALIVSTFLLGAIAGTLLFARMAFDALLVPAALTGAVGVGYAVYRHRALLQGAARG